MEFSKALVVDDSKLARVSLRKQLQKHGLNVTAVESGKEAIKFLNSSDVDIIFMDHLMPDMSGFEAMATIRNMPAKRQVPIIMCSGKEGPEYKQEAILHGAVSILAKPAKDESIKLALKEAFKAVGSKKIHATIASVNSGEQVPRRTKDKDPQAKLVNSLKTQVTFLSRLAAEQEQHIKQLHENVKKLQTAVRLDDKFLKKEIGVQLEERFEPLNTEIKEFEQKFDKQKQLFEEQEILFNGQVDAFAEQNKNISALYNKQELVVEHVSDQDEKISELEQLLNNFKLQYEQDKLELEVEADMEPAPVTAAEPKVQNIMPYESIMNQLEKQLDYKLIRAVDNAMSRRSAESPQTVSLIDNWEQLIDDKIAAAAKNIKASDSELKEIAQMAIGEAITHQAVSSFELDESVREEVMEIAKEAGKNAGAISFESKVTTLIDSSSSHQTPIFGEVFSDKVNEIDKDIYKLENKISSSKIPAYLAIVLAVIAIAFNFIPL